MAALPSAVQHGFSRRCGERSSASARSKFFVGLEGLKADFLCDPCECPLKPESVDFPHGPEKVEVHNLTPKNQ